MDVKHLLNDNYITELYAYSRKSRDEDGEGLQKHHDVLTEYADELGLPLHFYEEIGSSETLHRPMMEKLRDDIKSRKVKVLLVYRLDRLTRKVTDLERLLDEFKFHELILIEVHRNRVVDYNDTIGTKLEGIMSDLYLEQVKIILTAGRRKALEVYGNNLVSAPLGYYNDREIKKLVPDENAFIIRRIYSEYLSGRSLNQIAMDLNREGFKTGKNGVFKSTAIYRILKNEKYKGTQTFGKQASMKDPITGKYHRKKKPKSEWLIYEDAHELIIDKETWEQVQTMMGKRGNGSGNRKMIHPLTKLIYCEKCGNSRSFQKQKYKSGKEVFFVRTCGIRNFATDELCSDKMMLADDIEDFLRSQIHLVVRPTILNVEKKLAKDNSLIKKQLEDPRIKQLRQEERDLNKKIDNVIDFITNRGANNRMEQQLNQLEAQLKDVQSRLAEFKLINGGIKEYDWIEHFFKQTEDLNHFQLGWNGWSNEKKNVFFHQYVEKVIIKDKQVTSIIWDEKVRILLELKG